MKFGSLQRALCAISVAAGAVVPAHADTITFTGVTPGTLLTPGQSINILGYTLSPGDGPGVIDSASAFGPGTGLDLAVPLGSSGLFYTGLNDSFLNVKKEGGGLFRVFGFDFGFVAALNNLFNPGEEAGRLLVVWQDGNGAVSGAEFAFGPADANGKFSFQSASGAGLTSLSQTSVSAIEFSACTFAANGNCESFNANFSQFALDNINIPEPGSLALALAALALTAGFTRRRA